MQLGLACIEAKPHTQLADDAPVGAPDPSLCVSRAQAMGPLESGGDPIAGVLGDPPAECRDLLAQDAVVVADDVAHLIRMLLPQPSRALDVGEEEDRQLCSPPSCATSSARRHLHRCRHFPP